MEQYYQVDDVCHCGQYRARYRPAMTSITERSH